MGKIITKVQRGRKRLALIKLRRALRVEIISSGKIGTLKALRKSIRNQKKMIAEFERKFNF